MEIFAKINKNLIDLKGLKRLGKPVNIIKNCKIEDFSGVDLNCGIVDFLTGDSVGFINFRIFRRVF